MEPGRGILYVVATPIGNLGDITDRARILLAEVDLVAAEDTRKTLKLFHHLGISSKLVAYHDHNEASMTPTLLNALAQGRNVALVSDAGTPLISDPGFQLVRAARERGVSVVPVPGANAAICALSAAGLPSDRFLFLGFAPRTSSQRRAWIERAARERGTLILYETAQRIVATLRDLGEVLGAHRRVVIARELTKRFETFLSGNAVELALRLESEDEQRRGEMVVLVQGCGGADSDGDDGQRAEQARVLGILAEELPLAQAVGLAARLTGGKRNTLYRLALDLGLSSAPDRDSSDLGLSSAPDCDAS